MVNENRRGKTIFRRAYFHKNEVIRNSGIYCELLSYWTFYWPQNGGQVGNDFKASVGTAEGETPLKTLFPVAIIVCIVDNITNDNCRR